MIIIFVMATRWSFYGRRAEKHFLHYKCVPPKVNSLPEVSIRHASSC